MMTYEESIRPDLYRWRLRMQQKPSLVGLLSKRLQTRINRVIPEKVHAAITSAIKHATRAVLLGAEFTTQPPLHGTTLEERELRVRKRITLYSNTAAAEGALTGAGGILLGLADFPLWLALKMKMLFEIAALYGFDAGEFKERVYLLYIFELAFSSQAHRNKIFEVLEDWESYQQQLPASIDDFDWRSFQQEYRDYIDIAKLLQLVPGIGAAVGAVVNHRLTDKLGITAMNAYRLRLLQAQKITGANLPR